MRKLTLISSLGLFALVAGNAGAQRALTRPTVDAAGNAGGQVTTVPLGSPGSTNATGASGGQGTGTGTGTVGGTLAGQTAPTTTGNNPGANNPPKKQGDTSNLPGWEKGVDFQPLNPNQLVDISMEDADLTELVRTIANITGRRFIFGGKVRNIKASLYSPQKVTVAEAYQAFLSILETNGLTVVPHGRFLKIIETTGAASQETPLYNSGQGTPTEDRFITRIHRLSHAQADEVANVLGHFKSKDGDITIHPGGNLLIMTDTGSNIRRMMQIVDEIDVGGSSDQVWIEPIHYTSASDIASRVNDLFDLKGSSAPGGKGGAGAAPAAAGSLHVTKVVADDRSTSVIIVATEPAYLRILEFIKRLDVPQNAGGDGGEIHVLPLQHADAVELTKTLNDIISGAAGGGGSQQPGGAPGGARPQVGNDIFEGRIKVSADKATNSIVVTSSLRDYAALRFVVDRLDMPRRQVFIEAVIMDLSINRSDTLSVSFHGGGVLPTTLDNTGNSSIVYGGLNPLNTVLPPGTNDPSLLQGMALGIRGPDVNGTSSLFGGTTGLSLPAFGVILNALATAGDADVLSTPHVLATDNEKAVINVGENVPLQTNIGGIPSLGGAAGGTAAQATPFFGGFGASPQRTDVGTKIEITPHLNESDEVRLDLNEEISEAREPQGQLGVVPITKRNAQTKLVVKDQQTVVIGGLMRNRITHTSQKIPVLGDIPVLGVLFRKNQNTMQKSNLVLILTPYIIREQADLRKVFERKMQERQEFLDRYFVFSDNSDYQPPKDYSRTNGLLEEIRQSYISIDERKKLEDLLRPKEVKTHAPGQPLEIPATGRGGMAAPQTGTPQTGTITPTPPPNVQVAPAVRSVDRVEH